MATATDILDVAPDPAEPQLPPSCWLRKMMKGRKTYKYLLSPDAVDCFVRWGSVTDLEWLFKYRAERGVVKKPTAALIPAATERSDTKILKTLLQYRCITHELCRDVPRQLLREANPIHLKWLITHGNFTHENIRLAVPVIIASSRIPISVINWLYNMQLLFVSDFNTTHLWHYTKNENLEMLNWLAEHGANPAEWGWRVFTRAMSVDNLCEWYFVHADMPSIVERLGVRGTCKPLVRIIKFHSKILFANKDTGSFLLTHAARYGCVQDYMLTRNNCLAHNGRALRAIANKGFQSKWIQTLRRELSRSDFASVGVVWPSIMEL
ncbi:MAG: hypothetical protein EBU92_10005 [Betaproteobacteria bacterium]|nr:hypothetical protein [Betaproteobacteria bacterium]